LPHPSYGLLRGAWDPEAKQSLASIQPSEYIELFLSRVNPAKEILAACYRVLEIRESKLFLKDGGQEVKETLLFPKKRPSASERHLHPQAMHKKAIKPNPQPDPRDHWFLGPPAFPTMQSSSSLLYK
jgi:hypothetical protein